MAMLVVASFVAAQDVIITSDSRKIDAQIIEVSQTEVRYKEKSNPNGPTFVLNTKDINSIIYANGSVSTFTHTQTNQAGAQQYGGSYQANSQLQPGSLITRSGKTYFYNGKGMSEAEYMAFVQNNCYEAWQSHQSGKKLVKNGWAFFGVGLGCIVLSIPLAFAPYSLYYDPILWGAGAGFLISSAVCLPIGYSRVNNSHEIYNAQCARKTASLEFGIQTSQNGIGLAMKF